MNKILTVLLCSASILSSTNYDYHGSTTASVTLAGSIIATQHVNVEKKYKRSECPVCKGKGFYISGDGISKVPCGYCEPDKSNGNMPVEQPPKTLIHRR